VYLIDKKEVKPLNYQKVAFHYEYQYDSLTGHFRIYNSADSEVTTEIITKNGWDEDELFKFIMTMRSYFTYVKKTKKSKDFVDNFLKTIKGLDFEKVNEHSKILGQVNNIDYINNMNKEVQEFIEKLNRVNNIEYANRETKN
jgi:hypothetical protein